MRPRPEPEDVSILRDIAIRAEERGLPFLLAGGHAVIAHGHPRNTFDVDLIIRRDDRDGWLKLALDLGYKLHHEGPTFLQSNPMAAEVLPLDLMFVNKDTFAKMTAEAAPSSSTTLAKVISLPHLLALKCHAIKHGHPARIVKDADDVIQLVQVNRLDINAPELRELFLKHGTEELYEKLQLACSES